MNVSIVLVKLSSMKDVTNYIRELIGRDIIVVIDVG